MSYIVKRSGKKVPKQSFDTYEKARSYVRKLLRKSNKTGKTTRLYSDDGWLDHNNPSISRYGYSIQRLSR